MKYQIVFGRMGGWQFRHDSDSVEKYDNDLPDGVHYLADKKIKPSAEKIQSIVDAISAYYNLRFVEKVSQDEWMKANHHVNWLFATINK